MFKFHTIGAFDRVINLPYCKMVEGTDKVYNGNAVSIDRPTAIATLTDATTGKGDVWVIYNVIRGVYGTSSCDAYWTAGDYVNLYSLTSLIGLEVEISNDEYTFASGPVEGIAANDTLIYGDNGKLTKAAATGCTAALKVIAVEGNILRCEVVAGE